MSHLTFFLLVSTPTPSSSSKIFSMFKVGEWRNLKQLFLSVTYSELTGERVWHLFVHFPQFYIHELPRKYSREKILHPRSIHEKKCWTHEIPTKKKSWTPDILTRRTFGPTKYPQEKNPRTHKILRRKRFRLTKHPREKFWDSHFSTLVSVLVGIVLQGGKELENMNF